ncbi:MAG: antibiotic biosynthesis monooxygenase [Burkholderiales bacterium]
MMAVIFEVTPRAGQADRYFDAAAALRDELGQIEGFISIERFESLTRPGTFLSLSYWQDEAAVARWRNHSRHRATQRTGRDSIFEHYGIRVANVVRDYDMLQRADAPADSNAAFLSRADPRRPGSFEAPPNAASPWRPAAVDTKSAFRGCSAAADANAAVPGCPASVDANAALLGRSALADPSAAFSARGASADGSTAFPRRAPSANIDAALP